MWACKAILTVDAEGLEERLLVFLGRPIQMPKRQPFNSDDDAADRLPAEGEGIEQTDKPDIEKEYIHLLTVAQIIAQASQYKPLRQSPAMAYAAAMTKSPPQNTQITAAANLSIGLFYNDAIGSGSFSHCGSS